MTTESRLKMTQKLISTRKCLSASESRNSKEKSFLKVSNLRKMPLSGKI